MANGQSEVAAAQVELEIPIDAPRERVWRGLVDEIGLWWRRDFFVGKSVREFILEPRPGGRVYEDWGDGRGMLWYTVISIDQPAALQLAGHLLPGACGGSFGTTLLSIELEEGRGGSTLLKLSDSVVGRLGPELTGNLTEGWQLLIRDALKPHVENRMREEGAR